MAEELLNYSIFFDSDDADTAELVSQSCAKSLQTIQELWGFASPQDCRIYVLNSNWLGSLFHAAPWPWRIWMGLTLPLWYFRTKRTWQVAAGWALPFGRRRFIGIKPPRLIQLSDRSMGSRIFVHTDDLTVKVQHTTCHELTHACAAHLKLPAWLNEGIAIFTVDHFAGETTVQEKTLELLRHSSPGKNPADYRRLDYRDQDSIVYLCVRGYWIVRYLQDTLPGLLKSLFGKHLRHHELASQIASACGLNRESFWSQIDQLVASHFYNLKHRNYPDPLEK